MSTSVILRRSGWRTLGDLHEAAARPRPSEADLPVLKIVPVTDTVLVRPGPA